MDYTGWTKRWRKAWKKGRHTDWLLWVMMDYFIDFAEFEDTTVFWPMVGDVPVKRSEHVFSVRELSKFLGATYQQTRSRLATMEKDGFLTLRTTHRLTHAKVLNYDKYQDRAAQNNAQNNAVPTQRQRTPARVPL